MPNLIEPVCFIYFVLYSQYNEVEAFLAENNLPNNKMIKLCITLHMH